VLLSNPPSNPLSARDEDENRTLSLDFNPFYLSSKSFLALVEGSGINSLEIIQARLLINLFEVGHGFHPAAAISMAATIRAADSRQPQFQNVPNAEEEAMTWHGIIILDR